jgi:hypothetical protein
MNATSPADEWAKTFAAVYKRKPSHVSYSFLIHYIISIVALFQDEIRANGQASVRDITSVTKEPLGVCSSNERRGTQVCSKWRLKPPANVCVVFQQQNISYIFSCPVLCPIEVQNGKQILNNILNKYRNRKHDVHHHESALIQLR